MARKLSASDRDEYRRLISSERYSESSRGRLPLADEAASDRSRVLYSSAFRRLQQKTQVFPLSKNAAVRSRLTHSLEVSSVGRLITKSLTRDFLSSLGDEWSEALLLMVETGCLMHDIGNPPFGHFAEVAVQRWFEQHWRRLYGSSVGDNVDFPTMEKLSRDFVEFDGNPQGVRIVTRLQGRTATERAQHGMNLTFSQLLTSLKYLRAPSEPKKDGLTKKPGFFESERDRIERARKGLDVRESRRFPLTYIVEAADDISYCLSDLEDGLDHGILSAREFFEAVRDVLSGLREMDLRTLTALTEKTLMRRSADASLDRDDFFVFKTQFTSALINRAARRYRERHDSIMKGELTTLFETGDDERALLDTLRTIAGRHLYSSSEVEQPLRVGLQVVSGILDHFGQLLRLSRSDVDELVEARRTGDRGKIRNKKRDPELLLCDILPQTYLDVYLYERDRPRGARSPEWEWFCRAHLVLDYLSGMTDDFAVRTYHAFAGIDHES